MERLGARFTRPLQASPRHPDHDSSHPPLRPPHPLRSVTPHSDQPNRIAPPLSTTRPPRSVPGRSHQAPPQQRHRLARPWACLRGVTRTLTRDRRSQACLASLIRSATTRRPTCALHVQRISGLSRLAPESAVGMRGQTPEPVGAFVRGADESSVGKCVSGRGHERPARSASGRRGLPGAPHGASPSRRRPPALLHGHET